MESHKFLLDEPPLQLLPSLATAIGLEEAIILQQLHYWLNNPKAGVTINGYKWVFNTYDEWHENFPFLSVRTIRRTFDNLEGQGLVVSEQLKRGKWDRTKFYRINYDVYDALPCVVQAQGGASVGLAGGASTALAGDSPKGRIDAANLDTSTEPNWPILHIAETTTETNTLARSHKTAARESPSSTPLEGRSNEDTAPYIDAFTKRTGKGPTKADVPRWRKAVREEVIAAGFTLEDFRAALDEHLSKRGRDGSPLSVKSPASVIYALRHTVPKEEVVWVEAAEEAVVT